MLNYVHVRSSTCEVVLSLFTFLTSFHIHTIMENMSLLCIKYHICSITTDIQLTLILNYKTYCSHGTLLVSIG
mgnify:CR=1 FL=1